MRQSLRETGLALPVVLYLLLLIAGVSGILGRLSIHGLTQIPIEQAIDTTYLAAEGAVNNQIAAMSVLGLQWEQKPSLSSQPASYTQYSPLSFSSTNGIPTCTTAGTACHRNMYPIGGGLIKNIGPVNGDGEMVDTGSAITDQLDPADPPDEDLTLENINAWTQVERLDESTPTAGTVGGSLSNAIAEGGNAKTIRFRITGISTKSVKGDYGFATVVAVAELPMS